MSPVKHHTVRRLTMDDLPAIVAVESKSFVPGARASEERLRKRLELGHFMYGVEVERELVGMIAFRYESFNRDDRDAFPKTQELYSMQPSREGANSGFLYNLAITPGNRNLHWAKLLCCAAARTIVEAGCTFAVGAMRVPSYRGSQGHPQENIAPSPELARAIDRYLAGGAFPTPEEFCCDPVLAFTRQATGGCFLWIFEDFEPEDTASGKLSVVIYSQAKTMLDHLNGIVGCQE